MMEQTIHELALQLGIFISHINQSIYITNGNKTLIINSLQSPKLKKILSNFDYYFFAVESFNFMGNETIDFSSISSHKMKDFDLFNPYFAQITDPFKKLCEQNHFLHCEEGEIVFDIGSKFGMSSIYFSQKVGNQGKVISIEPNANNFICLTKNIETYKNITNINNIEILKAAIWEDSGFIDFSNDRNFGLSPVKIVGNKYSKSKVKSITLSDITKDYNLKSVNKIKINSSTSGLEILNDSNFFQTFRPKILIELNENEDDLLDILKQYGYKKSKINSDLPLYIFSI